MTAASSAVAGTVDDVDGVHFLRIRQREESVRSIRPYPSTGANDSKADEPPADFEAVERMAALRSAHHRGEMTLEGD